MLNHHQTNQWAEKGGICSPLLRSIPPQDIVSWTQGKASLVMLVMLSCLMEHVLIACEGSQDAEFEAGVSRGHGMLRAGTREKRKKGIRPGTERAGTSSLSCTHNCSKKSAIDTILTGFLEHPQFCIVSPYADLATGTGREAFCWDQVQLLCKHP